MLQMLKHGLFCSIFHMFLEACNDPACRSFNFVLFSIACRNIFWQRILQKNLIQTTSTKPGRAGVPLEVMGLMLGEFEDDYSVQVVDVFAMPQLGTGVSVEAVDPVFQVCQQLSIVANLRSVMICLSLHSNQLFLQKKMMDMLTQTGRCVSSFYDPLHFVVAHAFLFIGFRTVNNLVLAGITPTLDLDAGFPV